MYSSGCRTPRQPVSSVMSVSINATEQGKMPDLKRYKTEYREECRQYQIPQYAFKIVSLASQKIFAGVFFFSIIFPDFQIFHLLDRKTCKRRQQLVIRYGRCQAYDNDRAIGVISVKDEGLVKYYIGCLAVKRRTGYLHVIFFEG